MWEQNDSGQATVPAGLSEVVAIAASYNIFALKNAGPNGATAQAQVVHGFMVDASVLDGGDGYTVPPLVVIKGGGGTGATVLAIVKEGAVVSFTVTNPGRGYTSQPQVLIAAPPISGSNGPTGATAKAEVVNGFVVCASVLGGGDGYTVPPLVVIKDGGGTGATVLAIVREGSVVDFTVTNPGSGYTSLPQVLIASPPPPFAPEIGIEVSRINADLTTAKVKLKVVLGRKYQLQASKDLKAWTITVPDFVAEAESLTQEFVVVEVGSYFRLVEIP